MNPKLRYIETSTRRFILALALVALVISLFAQDVGIQWGWRHGRILERYDANGGTKLELGLRGDGVVVWREVTFSTNSPAETQFRRNRMNPTFVPPISTNNLPPPLPQ